MLSVPNAGHFEVCLCEWLEEQWGEDSLYSKEREGKKDTEGGLVYTLSKTAALALLLALVCNPIPLSKPHSPLNDLPISYNSL